MGFEREVGIAGACNVRGAEAQLREGLVGIAVKQDVVIGHVEMAVVVDPLLFDCIGRAYDRGRNCHRNFCVIC